MNKIAREVLKAAQIEVRTHGSYDTHAGKQVYISEAVVEQVIKALRADSKRVFGNEYRIEADYYRNSKGQRVKYYAVLSNDGFTEGRASTPFEALQSAWPVWSQVLRRAEANGYQQN